MGQAFTFETSQSGNKSATDTWLTPPYIYNALGEFDLDPCAAPEPRPWDIAPTNYDITQGQDGLILDWHGRVFCNPPYGEEMGKFMLKLAQHKSGIGLIFARTETKAWQSNIWPYLKGALFLSGRLKFFDKNGKQGGTAGSPSVLVAFSYEDAKMLRTCGLPGAFIGEAEVIRKPNVSGLERRIQRLIEDAHPKRT